MEYREIQLFLNGIPVIIRVVCSKFGYPGHSPDIYRQIKILIFEWEKLFRKIVYELLMVILFFA